VLIHEICSTCPWPGEGATFAILTLSLGIGAVTTIFSIVDNVVLKPLAYEDAGRLYAASESVAKFAHVYPNLPVNGSHFWSWQKHCQSCESAALLNPGSFNLTGSGEPEVVDGATCTWPLFQVLGVKPELGGRSRQAMINPMQTGSSSSATRFGGEGLERILV
jgi:hypothetical protein